MLGVLLYVVLSIVDQSIDPDPISLDTGDTPDAVAPPAIRTRTDLELALKGKGIDVDVELQATIDWYEQRGFLGPLPVYGRMEPGILQKVYADSAAGDLLQLAGLGDIGAAQALAELSMNSDNNNPVEAIEWYRQAASYGSIYAMFRISELLQIFSNDQLDAFNSDPVYAARLQELRANKPFMDRDALAWSITGVLAGGLPAAQPATVDSINAMAAMLGEGGTVRACDKANRLLLDLAAERRSRDRLVFSTAPPPLFVSAPNVRSAIPCEATSIPIVDSSGCKAVSVPGLINPNQTLWRCGQG
jgi:TPR repeat protein